MRKIAAVACLLLAGAPALPGQNVAPAPIANRPAPGPAVPAPSEVVAAAGPATPGQRHALEPRDLEAFLDGVIPLQLERSDLGGAAVLVMRGDEVLLKKGYGYADAKKKTPVDPDATLFRLASISKLFTWISVMQLVEQGRLDLDTDVNRYLDFKIEDGGWHQPVTLRNLMTHTGGFEEQIEFVVASEKAHAFSLRDYLVRYQPKRIYPPGQVGAYSNYGVGLAGYIVQRTSGERFEDYVRRHIFEPLQMTHSTFEQPPEKSLYPMVSNGYTETARPPVGFEVFNPMPAGGLASTAGDMSRFARMLLGTQGTPGELDGKRVLRPETIRAMLTRQFAASKDLPAMCMGFYEVLRNGLRFVGHNGDLTAFHSQFEVEPEKKLAYFISYNSAGNDERGASSARPEVFESLLNRYYPYTPVGDFRPLTGRDRDAAGTYFPSRRQDSNRIKLLSLFVETHCAISKDGELVCDRQKDRRGQPLRYRPLGNDLWQDSDVQGRLFAVRDGQGKVVRLAGNFGGAQMVRVPWWERLRVIGPPALLAVLSCLLTVLAMLVRQYKRWFRRKQPAVSLYPGSVLLTHSQRWAGLLWLLAVPVLTLVMALVEDKDPLPNFAVLPAFFAMQNVLVLLALLVSIPAVIATVRIFRRADVRFASKLKYAIVGFSYIFLACLAVHFHLIGGITKY